jgi:hypothetical protein
LLSFAQGLGCDRAAAIPALFSVEGQDDLEGIAAKIGVSSRAPATRYTTRHGLVNDHAWPARPS